MAKKTKKKTTKKKATKKSTSKKSIAKKTTTKKKSSKKKVATKKKSKTASTSKKKTTKKVAKKTATKKKAGSKKSTKTKSSAKKKTVAEKKTTRKSSAQKTTKKKVSAKTKKTATRISKTTPQQIVEESNSDFQTIETSKVEIIEGDTPSTNQKTKSTAAEIIDVSSSGEARPRMVTQDKSSDVKSVQAEIVDKIPDRDQDEVKESYSHLPSSVTDGLGHYLAEIRKYPLLTKEEEQKIARRYKELGDPKDAEILVTSNLRFVVKVAAEYAKFGSKLIDLIQEGNVGLMHAVKEFNPYKGVRLITYAVWWIRGYIQEYLMKQYSMVKIGTTANQRKLFYRLEKEKRKLDQEGLEATPKLISARLGVNEDDVRLMETRMQGRDISLDAPLDSESGVSLLDFESTDEALPDDLLGSLEQIEKLRQTVEALKDDLNEKETYILETRILSDEPKKLQEIGEEWGVTREAVRQMEARVIKKIKDRVLAL